MTHPPKTTRDVPIPEAFEEAGRAWKAGRHAKAVSICEAIVAAAPRHVDALNLLGLSLYSLDRKDEAKTVLTRALAIKSRADLHNNIALIHKSLEEFDSALSHYVAAVMIKPDYAEAHANLGRMLRQSGNPGGAIKHLQRAADLGWRHANLHADLAVTLFEAGRIEPALEQMTQWLMIDLPKMTTLPALGPPRQPSTERPFAAALVAAAEELDRAKIPFFLGDGTALGYVRDRAFISFDKDIDIGLDDSVSRQEVLALFDASTEFWIDVEAETRKADLLITVRYRRDVAIDIFFYKSDGAHVTHGMTFGGHDMLWRQSAFRLKPVPFLGRSFNIPSPAEIYLFELYGAGWKTPDPNYCAFVTGDIVGTLPPLCRIYALMALQGAIADGRRTHAIGVATGLLERLIDPADGPLRGVLADFAKRFG